MIVWASNRAGGRHEIFRMKADGSGVTQLTTGGGKFAAWSPDGGWISYQRGSLATYLIRWDGSGERKIFNGPCRFWLLDGRGLVCRGYGPNKNDFVVVDPKTGTSHLLAIKGDFAHVKDHNVEEMGVTRDGRFLLAVTDRYLYGYTGSNGTFKANPAAVALDLLDTSALYFVGGGCGPSAAPQGDWIYHVWGGGMGECPFAPDIYRLKKNDLATRKSYEAVVSYNNADWGHTYFPRVSNDNRWLVYSATTGCHDHEVCDYEIFLHELGKPGDRQRLTFNTANDQWPDIFVGEPAEAEDVPSAGCGVASGDDGSPSDLLVLMVVLIVVLTSRSRASASTASPRATPPPAP